MMRARALIPCVVAAVALPAAGCGSDEPGPVGPYPQEVERSGDAVTVTRTDESGDVNLVSSTIDAPEFARLDLQTAKLRRDSEDLTVTLTTAKPPRAQMTETFIVADNERRQETRVVVRWTEAGKPPSARLFRTGSPSRPVSVAVRGSAVTVRFPTAGLTKRPSFRWQAWTTATGGDVEITDTLPDRYGNVAFFPGQQPKAER